MTRFAQRIWYRLPLDGAGILPPRSPRLRLFQRVAARGFWKRFPAVYRLPAIVLARLLWLAACPLWIIIEWRRTRPRIADARAALWVGWTLGRHPRETILYRSMAGDNRARARLVAEIPSDRQSGLLLTALGDRTELRLASDKLACTERLAALGFPTAPILTEVIPCQNPRLDEAPWNSANKLLVKPRHGGRAEGLFSVHYRGNGLFSVSNRIVMGGAALAPQMMAAARRGSLLVQPYIGPSPATLDLCRDAPAVVRAFVMRRAPGESAFVVTAMLKILPPGVDAPRGVNELLLIPIALNTGTLEDGILLSRPRERWSHMPWNSAPVRGRPAPGWTAIRDIVIRASAILPSAPVIGWDVLLGPDGPIILEANTSISLFRAMLWHFENGVPSPLGAALETWCLAQKLKTAVRSKR